MSAINADPEVMRWIGDGSIRDEQETRAGIEAWEHEWDRHGFGLFALELRTTGELIGFAGLAVPGFLPEVMPAVEIGWRLGHPFWGRGLATEAARVALRFGLIDRGLERIVSIAQVGNDASERIMDKLGMCLERETVDPSCDRRVRVHAIRKADYLSAGREVITSDSPLQKRKVSSLDMPLTTGDLGGRSVSFLVSYIHVHQRPSAFTVGR